ncbi:MAG: hypothetical protein VKJ02_18580 [Snowella sp.]|nr:hypothetical protein [Snowella sp.]
MVTQVINLEKSKLLLKLVDDYRNQGYEVVLKPNPEQLPDFLKNYHPDLLLSRGNETVVVELASRFSFDSSSSEYFRSLAKVIKQHPHWRFELVMTNPEETANISTENWLQADEIHLRLPQIKSIAQHNLEAAIVYAWSLIEATLRLIAKQENLSLKRLDPFYLVKLLVMEGVIDRYEYKLLMKALSLRNAIAHGLKTEPLTEQVVNSVVELTEKLLQDLSFNHC